MADALKEVYTPEYIARLAEEVKKHASHFNEGGFVAAVFDDAWESRELKARMFHIRRCLHEALSSDYANAIKALWQPATGFGGFEAMFFPDFVEAYGLDDWDVSIPALEWFTQYSSSEFAVRPFITADSDRMMAIMHSWATHENEHVRRLSSEGCRPRLPWAMALPAFKKDPAPIFPILDLLRNDESEYVRRSVANNLNDISKDHPETVLSWAEAHIGETDHTDRLIKHALRGLLKQAQPRALALFGYASVEGRVQGDLRIEEDAASKGMAIGDSLNFFAELSCNQGPLGKLRIEYIIDYQKASGKTASKVFSWREVEVSDSSFSLTGKQSFKQMTTRKHYAGQHKVRLRVNGCELAQTVFMLHASA